MTFDALLVLIDVQHFLYLIRGQPEHPQRQRFERVERWLINRVNERETPTETASA